MGPKRFLGFQETAPCTGLFKLKLENSVKLTKD